MINSAEMKCLRESMGLTTKWLAIRWGVAESSVKRWEHTRLLHEPLEQDLRALKKRFDTEVRQQADAADSNSHTGRQTILTVPRVDGHAGGDYPASWYRAIAQQVRDRCGARIRIEFKDDEG